MTRISTAHCPSFLTSFAELYSIFVVSLIQRKDLLVDQNNSVVGSASYQISKTREGNDQRRSPSLSCRLPTYVEPSPIAHSLHVPSRRWRYPGGVAVAALISYPPQCPTTSPGSNLIHHHLATKFALYLQVFPPHT